MTKAKKKEIKKNLEVKRKSTPSTAEEKELPEVYADEEQGILPEEPAEEVEEEMKHGQKDKDVYTKEGRDVLEEEEDEIEPWEEGFMEGAHDAGQLAKDALTGEPLMDIDDVIEVEIKGETYRFVNEENAQKFREEMKKGKKKRED